MPEPRIFRLLLFCRASLLALTICASHSLFAQAPPATQSEVPPDDKAYREAILLLDPQRRIDAMERFLIDYPQSRYAAGIPNLIFGWLIKDGQKEKILAQANRIIDKAPENAKSVAYHAVAAKLLGAGILLDEAEVFAVKAVSTFKEGKFLELQRQSYNMRGQTPPPDGYLLRGFNSTRATYLVTLGQVYLKKGRDAEAEKAFKDAHKASPSLEAASIGLATVVAKSGDNTGGLSQTRSASNTISPVPRARIESCWPRSSQAPAARPASPPISPLTRSWIDTSVGAWPC